MAVWSSGCGGDLSIGSSVTLKSPRTKSGRGIRARVLLLLMRSQNSGWLHFSTGAYMLRMVIFLTADHAIESMTARPGIKVLTLMLSGAMRALFIIKATPAVALGFSGSPEK